MGGAPPHRAVSRKWGHVVKMKPHVAVKTYGDVRANVSHVNSIPAFPTLIGKSHRSPAFPSPPHVSLPDLSGSLLRCPQHRQPRSPAFRRSPNSRRPLSWGPASPTQGPLSWHAVRSVCLGVVCGRSADGGAELSGHHGDPGPAEPGTVAVWAWTGKVGCPTRDDLTRRLTAHPARLRRGLPPRRKSRVLVSPSLLCAERCRRSPSGCPLSAVCGVGAALS